MCGGGGGGGRGGGGGGGGGGGAGFCVVGIALVWKRGWECGRMGVACVIYCE